MRKAFNALVAVGCTVGFVAPTIANAQTTGFGNPAPHANEASSTARVVEKISFVRSLDQKNDFSIAPSEDLQAESRITNMSASSVRGTNTTTAQSTAPATSSSQAGPLVTSTRLGVSAVSRSTGVPASLAASPRAGQSVALMVVGGGALLTGLIIGGDAGTLISVTGVVIGLYGLYNYVK